MTGTKQGFGRSKVVQLRKTEVLGGMQADMPLPVRKLSKRAKWRFNNTIRSRAYDEWTPADVAAVTRLAETEAMAEELMEKIAADGMYGEDGSEHPLFAQWNTMQRLILAMSRTVALHAGVSTGSRGAMRKRAEEQLAHERLSDRTGIKSLLA
jgi:hypothetical protein